MSQAPTFVARQAADATLLAMAYAGLRLSVAMTLVVYVVFVGFVLRHFPGASTHAWGGTLVAVALLRYALWAIRRNITQREEGHRRWPWRGLFIAGTSVAGASWAAGPVLLVPDAQPATALLLALVVLAVGAVSIATHAADWYALLGFLLAAFLPTVTVLGLADDELVQLDAGEHADAHRRWSPLEPHDAGARRIRAPLHGARPNEVGLSRNGLA